MSKTTYTIIGLIIIALIAIFAFGGNEANAPADNATTTPTSTPQTATTTDNTDTTSNATTTDKGAEDVVISYTNSGFQPTEVNVSAGTQVIFKNNSASGMWPAVDVHPTHSQYDGTTLQQHCNGRGATFDSCTEIAPSASWAFTFEKTGEWSYHNHTRPSHTGTIIVE